VDINLSLLGQAITFAILVWFTMKFVWPPLTRMMDARAAHIADGLAAADRAKLDLELTGRQIVEKLREAKGQAAQIVTQAEQRATHVVEEARLQARAEGERIIAAAKAEVQQEFAQAKEALRQQVADLVIAGAEQILRREIDAKQHSVLLSQIKTEL
jgi:F-type H+-transporting ATPase subunit b